jgi:hypothetical protein
LVRIGDEFVSVGVEIKGNTFSLSETRPLFRESLAAAAFPYDVSPDGQRFLVHTFGDGTEVSPLTLVVNWKELLKNKQGRIDRNAFPFGLERGPIWVLAARSVQDAR